MPRCDTSDSTGEKYVIGLSVGLLGFVVNMSRF